MINDDALTRSCYQSAGSIRQQQQPAVNVLQQHSGPNTALLHDARTERLVLNTVMLATVALYVTDRRVVIS